MVNSASEMLIAATIEFLQSFPPFDRMESDALRFLAERVKLAYYPKETQIITPEAGVVPVFRILQRGKVVARPAGPPPNTFSLWISIQRMAGWPSSAARTCGARRPMPAEQGNMENSGSRKSREKPDRSRRAKHRRRRFALPPQARRNWLPGPKQSGAYLPAVSEPPIFSQLPLATNFQSPGSLSLVA